MTPMTYEFVQTTVADGLFTLTLNRPEKLNAISVQLDSEWIRALREAIANPDVRVILQCGNGRIFSAGHDIVEVGRTIRELGADASDWTKLYAKIWPDGSPNDVAARCPKPLVSAVHGMVVGQAVLPVFSSDIIVAAEGTVFNVEAARVGGGAGLKGLIGVLPHRLLAELAMVGTLRAEDLHSAGVINRVVPADQLLPTAVALARAISAVHPDTTMQFKRSMYDAMDRQGINDPEAVEDGGATSHGNPADNEFYMRAAEHGVTEAVRWRDEDFGGGAFITSKGSVGVR